MESMCHEPNIVKRLPGDSLVRGLKGRRKDTSIDLVFETMGYCISVLPLDITSWQLPGLTSVRL